MTITSAKTSSKVSVSMLKAVSRMKLSQRSIEANLVSMSVHGSDGHEVWLSTTNVMLWILVHLINVGVISTITENDFLGTIASYSCPSSEHENPVHRQ